MLTMAFAPMMRDAALAADIDECRALARYSQKQAALDMRLGPGHCSEQLTTGSVALWRLLRLSDTFWLHFLPRLAARFGMVVISQEDARWLRAGKHLRLALGVDTADPCAADEERRHA